MTAPRRRNPSFATRLLVAQTLVLLAGTVTAWLVATAVGPGLFRDHLRRAGFRHNAAEQTHAEQAFGSALLISLLVALVGSALLAFAVTWYFTRRIQRSVDAVATSAAQIAEGSFGARVHDPGLGAEFEQLTSTFNRLAERLESTESTRRQLLSDLAHELRTPLATVDAHLEALEDGVRQLDAETLEVLRSATERLGRLADDIGAVSRAQEGRVRIARQPTSPTELVEAAAAAHAEQYRSKGVTLVLGSTARQDVSVDPERLGQVLGNLLDNAVRHTPSGGRVHLTARDAGPEWVELAVADTGSGITPEQLGHVFDRFYRGEASRNRGYGGSGIGLTISRALVEAQGGTITAESPGVDRGATFTIRLPTGPAGG